MFCFELWYHTGQAEEFPLFFAFQVGEGNMATGLKREDGDGGRGVLFFFPRATSSGISDMSELQTRPAGLSPTASGSCPL